MAVKVVKEEEEETVRLRRSGEARLRRYNKSGCTRDGLLTAANTLGEEERRGGRAREKEKVVGCLGYAINKRAHPV